MGEFSFAEMSSSRTTPYATRTGISSHIPWWPVGSSTVQRSDGRVDTDIVIGTARSVNVDESMVEGLSRPSYVHTKDEEKMKSVVRPVEL